MVTPQIQEMKQVIEQEHNDEGTVTLRLPSTLSTYSDGKSQIVLHARTVEEMLAQLAKYYPRVWHYLCNEQGHVREQVKMFVNNEVVSGAHGLQTPLVPGQEVIVLPVTSGF